MSNALTIFRDKRLFDLIRSYVAGTRKRLTKLFQPGVSIAWGKLIIAIIGDPVIQSFLDYFDLGSVWWVYKCHRIEVFKPRGRLVIVSNPPHSRKVRYELEKGFDTLDWIDGLPQNPYTYQVTTSAKRSIWCVDN